MKRLDYVVTDDEDFDELMLVIHGIPRTIHERANYFESFDQPTFQRRFRISKEIAVQILREIELELELELEEKFGALVGFFQHYPFRT